MALDAARGGHPPHQLAVSLHATRVRRSPACPRGRWGALEPSGRNGPRQATQERGITTRARGRGDGITFDLALGRCNCIRGEPDYSSRCHSARLLSYAAVMLVLRRAGKEFPHPRWPRRWAGNAKRRPSQALQATCMPLRPAEIMGDAYPHPPQRQGPASRTLADLR
jgi:hypothetical protein